MDDETRLWQAYHSTHDPATRETLILRYVPLVHFVLGRLGLAPGPEYEDLISQGMLGLIEAVDRYDPAHRTRFSTYATLRIHGQIVDALRRLDLLSRPARRRVRAIQAAMTELQQQLGRSPTEEELATHVELDVDTLRSALADASLVLISLDTTTNADDGLYESLPDQTSQPNPDEVVTESEARRQLGEAIGTLPEREQQVLSLYYFEELTMKEIGHVLQVSESRVSQLHAKAILGLRAIIAAESMMSDESVSPRTPAAAVASSEAAA